MPYPTPGFVVRQTFLEFEPCFEETPPPLVRSHSDSCLLGTERPVSRFGSEELRLYYEQNAATLEAPENSLRTSLQSNLNQNAPTHPTPSSTQRVESSSLVEASSLDIPVEQRTTVTLSNLPSEYTRRLLIETLVAEGFQNTYDFVYLPMDLRTQKGNGYALINFQSNQVAKRALAHFDGFGVWLVQGSKTCVAEWSQFVQGLPALIDRYRNSPIMHNAVPDIYKPSLFDPSGNQLFFPEPTKRIRLPRLRRKGKEQSDLDSDGEKCGEGANSFSSSQSQKDLIHRNRSLSESQQRNVTKNVPFLLALEKPSCAIRERKEEKPQLVEEKATEQSNVAAWLDSGQQEPASTVSTPRCEPFTATPSPGQWVWGT